MRGQRQAPKDAGCRCPNAKLERFIEPCLLLLLAERPSHGYELIERLSNSEFSCGEPDPGLLYRTLRRLEEQQVVASAWSTGGAGPARRPYQLTPLGTRYLASWRQQIDQNVQRLQCFQERHTAVCKQENEGEK